MHCIESVLSLRLQMCCVNYAFSRIWWWDSVGSKHILECTCGDMVTEACVELYAMLSHCYAPGTHNTLGSEDTKLLKLMPRNCILEILAVHQM